MDCPQGTVYDTENDICIEYTNDIPLEDIPYDPKKTDSTCDIFYWEPYSHITRLPWYMK